MNRNFLPNMLILSAPFSQGTSGDYGGGTENPTDYQDLYDPVSGLWFTYDPEGPNGPGWYGEDEITFYESAGTDWTPEGP